MKMKAIASAVMALLLSTSGVAFADDHHDDHHDDHDGRRPTENHGPRGRTVVINKYSNDGRGAGPSHNFHRGDRLPAEYRNRQYVVSNWREHRLSAPPRGYQWVQTGGDYVLAAIGTGVILQLLLGNN